MRSPDAGTLLSRVPSDWLSQPVWVPGVQPRNRAVRVKDRVWHMGVDNPLAPERSSPPITMSHVKLAIALLSFWRGSEDISMSLGDLAGRVASSRGGRYMRDILRKLEDLREYWIRIEEVSGETRTFSLLGSVDLVSNPPRRRTAGGTLQPMLCLDRVRLHREFADLMRDIAATMCLNYQAFRALRSDMAQALYLYLPSRAVHHEATDPFQITLQTLYAQLGRPDIGPKSVRRKLLLQRGEASPLAQLDGSELLAGRLRVSMAETVDKKDYKLLVWSEKPTSPPAQGKLAEAWRQSGRSDQEFRRRLATGLPLDDYDEELARESGVDFDAVSTLLAQTKALLGPSRLQRMLAERRQEAVMAARGINSDKAPRNPTAALIAQIMRETASPPARSAED